MTKILMALLVAAACAAGSGNRVDENGKRVAIYENQKLGLYLSADCEKPGGKLRCRAYDVLKAASFKAVENNLVGGANPGAVICEAISGVVMVLKDEKGNEYSYCRFEDESLVANGTLTRYGRENDSKAHKRR